MTDLAAAKRAARETALALRHGLDPVGSGMALSGHVLSVFDWPSDAVVSGFWPLGQEIDIRPLLHALHDKGHPISLPVTPLRGESLTFRRWRPGDVLTPERFGTMHSNGAIITPDVLLIPLLAFDAAGGRLGYGGGFYDRTLEALPGHFRLGCAFAVQQVDAVPVGPYDMRLNAVATDTGIIRCEGSNEDTVSG